FWSSVGAEPDGGTVTQGGAEAQITSVNSRNIYTNVAGNALTAVGNRVNKSNSNITKAILGIDGDTNEAREKILDWARGVDVNDENGDGSRTDMRHTVGDPLHSEPVLVTYGGGDESSDVTVFMGTNEGFIHAFDGRNGQEYFAFIPDELLRNLATLQRNRGTWQGRPYGMDGPLVAVTQGTGVGKSVTLVAGMRRGGRSYYALDVSNREAPRIAWKITGGQTTGFAELGQTWSTPILAKVPYGGATEEVLIFGGGYDPNQDARTSPPLSDSMGRAVFMVRASDGQLLWSAGNAAGSVDYPVAEMQASVPATPSVVDLDNDGLADRIYIADTNAKLFRFDIDPLNGGRNNFAAGGMIAHVGGPDAAANRKFYNAPDVSISISPDTDPILTISIGSGFRAHPLQQGVQDRFFVFFDPDVRPGQTKTFALGPIDDTATELYDATSNLVGSSDPEVAQAAREELFSRRGAFINLREGEKSLTVSRTFDNRVVFATFQPGRVDGDDLCAAGSGTARMYLLNVLGLSAAEDLNESGGDPTTGDRDRELKVRGIPPNPVVLFPDSDDGPIRPIIFVGPESYEPNVEIRAEKTTWEALEPGPLEIEEGGQ
ncbi:MAG: PilC/PilY family type IV pilus protein, partial [Oceanococcaceae bacterium]